MRELENAVIKALIFAKNHAISVSDLPHYIKNYRHAEKKLKYGNSMETSEKMHIEEVLNQCRHNKGGGGISLNVFECGNPQGKPIFFIHGFSQSGICFRKQLDSDLARDFRLVSINNRGHGDSDKPRDAYGDSKLWADDIKAVITELNLDKPVLSGWSYGGVIILDYIRYHGEDDITGANFIGACLLGSRPVSWAFSRFWLCFWEED